MRRSCPLFGKSPFTRQKSSINFAYFGSWRRAYISPDFLKAVRLQQHPRELLCSYYCSIYVLIQKIDSSTTASQLVFYRCQRNPRAMNNTQFRHLVLDTPAVRSKGRDGLDGLDGLDGRDVGVRHSAANASALGSRMRSSMPMTP